MRIGRREAVAVTVGALLVVAAFVVPDLHLGIVTPLIRASPARLHSFADTAPIFGWWKAHVGWGTVPAIVIGAAAVLWGQVVAGRLNKQIASDLGTVEGTIKVHRARVMDKMRARSLADLVRLVDRIQDRYLKSGS